MLQHLRGLFSGEMPVDPLYSGLVRLIDVGPRNRLAPIWVVIFLVGAAAPNS
jgi:hypothetical protein